MDMDMDIETLKIKQRKFNFNKPKSFREKTFEDIIDSLTDKVYNNYIHL